MPMICLDDPDFRVCRISFQTLLDIQLEAQERGWGTRWSSVDAVRSQVREAEIILQSLMREEHEGTVRSYRCLALFSTADGDPSGGLATIDVAPLGSNRSRSWTRTSMYRRHLPGFSCSLVAASR